jgi:aminoglycoside/choline kinase family phosphotransferase
MQTRENALNQWLKTIVGNKPYDINLLAGDASFRRYFRLFIDGHTQVIMDAPPEKETMLPFIQIGELLAQHGIMTPKIYASDLTQGFALLEDFGDRLLLNVINIDNADKLYTQAMTTLIKMQQTPTHNPPIPAFDKTHILMELNVFHEWFLSAYLNLRLDDQQQSQLDYTFDWLSTEIMKQSQVFIHRDYHSRNLILMDKSLGVIDFQDAMLGPISYDLVSLLKDCYIQWPRKKVIEWMNYFHHQLPSNIAGSASEFHRGFDLCGLQRHLKVLGVFCRLNLRDNKSGYMRELPLIFNYILACSECYEELKPFHQFMQQTVQGLFLEKNIS